MGGEYLGVGENEAIGVGDDFQEDVHFIQNGGQRFIFAIITDDLNKAKTPSGISALMM